MSTTFGVRYRWLDVFNMYFNTVAVGSASGIIQEFDDEIEEIFEAIVDEFGEFISEESGKSVSESIPVASIVAKSMVPIFQAGGNYAYVIYNGNRFLSSIANQLEENPLELSELNRKIRKEARKEKYSYVMEMTKKIGVNGKDIIKDKLFRKKHVD